MKLLLSSFKVRADRLKSPPLLGSFTYSRESGEELLGLVISVWSAEECNSVVPVGSGCRSGEGTRDSVL